MRFEAAKQAIIDECNVQAKEYYGDEAPEYRTWQDVVDKSNDANGLLENVHSTLVRLASSKHFLPDPSLFGKDPDLFETYRVYSIQRVTEGKKKIRNKREVPYELTVPMKKAVQKIVAPETVSETASEDTRDELVSGDASYSSKYLFFRSRYNSCVYEIRQLDILNASQVKMLKPHAFRKSLNSFENVSNFLVNVRDYA